MNNVVSLMDLLPVRVRDTRIVALHAAFGTERFDVFQASSVLGLSLKEMWDLLFYEPLLADDLFRVAGDNGGFRLLATPPAKAALMEWRNRYLPILRGLPQPFGPQDFATAASIPFPTANFLLATFLKHGLVRQNFTGDAAQWRTKPRPRVIMQAERPRRVIYTGY